jgi:hypothetical protein
MQILTLVRGSDRKAYAQRWDGSKWSGWFGLGGQLATPYIHVRQDPQTPSRVDIFVQGDDGAMWHKWSDDFGAHWQPGGDSWESLGGQMNGPIFVL